MGKAVTAITLPSLAFAISLAQMITVFVVLLLGSQLGWSLRCSLRREKINIDAILAIDEALADTNYETAVGALLEWQHRLGRELKMQEAHPWSALHFWRRPPGHQEEWVSD